MPNTLIESWLPFEAIGAESLRERGASSALPPLYFLHVWWARRPLTVSRAAIVASLLPSWETLTSQESDSGREKGSLPFPNEAAYRAWFLRFLGIKGDPVETRERITRARETGENLGPNPYGYSRAFTINPEADDLAIFERLVGRSLDEVTFLDPFSGGGSIPFESRRYGLATIANELNPVAAVILKATLDYPAEFGPELAADIQHWGRRWSRRVRQKLTPFFPKQPGENIFAYLWARTVACPVTGKPVPLSPNWWLSKGNVPVAAQLLVDPDWDAPRFRIVHLDSDSPPLAGEGPGERFDPDEGTVSRGVGRSPWTGDAIDGDYIKAEAQAGRMGQMLYAVALKRRGGFDFRAPTEEDLAAVAAAETELARMQPMWEAKDIIPTESFPAGNDMRPPSYGMPTWAAFFSPRQILTIATFVETLLELGEEIPQRSAIQTLLALAIDKAVDYDSVQTFWDPNRGIRHTFSRHDFAFRWAFSEFDAARNLLPWCIT